MRVQPCATWCECLQAGGGPTSTGSARRSSAAHARGCEAGRREAGAGGGPARRGPQCGAALRHDATRDM